MFCSKAITSMRYFEHSAGRQLHCAESPYMLLVCGKDNSQDYAIKERELVGNPGRIVDRGMELKAGCFVLRMRPNCLLKHTSGHLCN